MDEELEHQIRLILGGVLAQATGNTYPEIDEVDVSAIKRLLTKREKTLLDKTMGEVEELFNGWYGLRHLTSDSAAGDFRLALQAMKDEKRDE